MWLYFFLLPFHIQSKKVETRITRSLGNHGQQQKCFSFISGNTQQINSVVPLPLLASPAILWSTRVDMCCQYFLKRTENTTFDFSSMMLKHLQSHSNTQRTVLTADFVCSVCLMQAVLCECQLTIFFFLKYHSSRYQQKKSPENKNCDKNYKPRIQPHHGLWWLQTRRSEGSLRGAHSLGSQQTSQPFSGRSQDRPWDRYWSMNILLLDLQNTVFPFVVFFFSLPFHFFPFCKDHQTVFHLFTEEFHSVTYLFFSRDREM